nr:MAG TPA: hypothetical protein [Caudoviricetes sp.]
MFLSLNIQLNSSYISTYTIKFFFKLIISTVYKILLFSLTSSYFY